MRIELVGAVAMLLVDVVSSVQKQFCIVKNKLSSYTIIVVLNTSF